MSEADANELTIDLQSMNEITGDDVRAARRAFTFLSACVDGDLTAPAPTCARSRR